MSDKFNTDLLAACLLVGPSPRVKDRLEWYKEKAIEAADAMKELEKELDTALGSVEAANSYSGEVVDQRDRAVEALKRLASNEGFVGSKMTTEEERARMFYARAALRELGEGE